MSNFWGAVHSAVSPKITPLLQQYLADSEGLNPDWLYDRWKDAIGFRVMQARMLLWNSEADRLQSICDEKGIKFNTLLAPAAEIRQFFPDSRYADYMEQYNNSIEKTTSVDNLLHKGIVDKKLGISY